MKQTKTAIKELTAAYRAVLKHAALMAAGVIVSVGAANAYSTTSDVNFEGKYNNGALDVNAVPDGNTQFGYTYNGTDASGNSVAIATPTAGANIDPETSNFKYSDKDGVASDLGTTHVVGDYSDTSSADSVVVFTTQSDIKADTAVNIENYTYVNGKGDTVQLGATAQVFTENVTLSDGTEWVANGTAVLDPTTYAVTYTSSLTGNEVTYYLDSAGTGLIDSNGAAVTLDPGETNGADKLSDVSSAYAADKALVTTANTNVEGWNSAETTNHATAIGAFNDDNARQQELSEYWNTYTVAKGAYDSIVDSTNTESPKYAAQQQLTEATDAQADALAVYQTPIQQLIDEGATSALTDAKSYADTQDASEALTRETADATLQTNIDDEVSARTSADTAIRSEFAEADATLQTNIDNEVSARADADTAIMEKIGDVSSFAGSTTGNITNGGAATGNTISDAIANIDASMGTIHGLKAKLQATNPSTGTNLAAGTTVEDHLTALDASIGDRSALTGSHVDGSKSVALNLQSLNDGIDASLAEAKAYADAQSSVALHSAQNYTDQKVKSLEKDVSAGIASATALSSVAVSNVGKGEVSVGGGYGYYNSQSAIALGAAMGISDNWSVNAGAGLSDGNVALRAGTNYKFKLF